MLGSRLWWGLLAIILAAAISAPRSARAQDAVYRMSTGAATYLGQTSLASLKAQAQSRTAVTPGTFAHIKPWLTNRQMSAVQANAVGLALGAVKVKLPKIKKPPSLVDDSPLGFDGIDAYANAVANPIVGDGNLEIEPPDQGLCVGNGTVLELTNTTMARYDTAGNLQDTVSLYSLMNVTLSSVTELLSDPRCIYDPGSKNFYITVTHAKADGSATDVRLAVLNSANFSASVYMIDTTDLSQSGCPCLEDEPLLGANGTTVFISGNEFTYPAGSFVQNVIYAISKSDLNNNVPAALERFFGFGYSTHGQAIPAFSMSPSVSPGGDYDTTNGGTEYFLASLADLNVSFNKIALWAFAGTCALPTNTGSPCSNPLAVGLKFIGNKKYITPLNSSPQMSGDYPLGQSLNDAEPSLDTGDDRMQQVVFSGGTLYGALDTALAVGGGVQTGVLWMSVLPRVKVTKKVISSVGANLAKVSGKKLRSGYVGLSGLDVFYPAIAVNSSGQVLIALDISGATIFPSVAYVSVAGGADMNVHKVVAGAGPDDGFTAYPQEAQGANGVGRWGDYTAATLDESGNFWIGGEYIAQTCTQTDYEGDPTCGGTRAQFTNWATRVVKLAP
jgi:hypothetical protein